MTTYFSHNPEGDFAYHDTAKAAKDAFEVDMQGAKDDLADFHSDDCITDICWGTVVQRLAFDDRDPTDEEKALWPEVDFMRDVFAVPEDLEVAQQVEELLEYLTEQFPATAGHIPLREKLNALAGLPA